MSEFRKYYGCHMCKHSKVEIPINIFTPWMARDYAKCWHPELIRLQRENRAHLGKSEKITRNALYCSTMRDGGRCGEEARYFQPRPKKWWKWWVKREWA